MAIESESMSKASAPAASPPPIKPTATNDSTASTLTAAANRPIKVLTTADYKAAAQCLAECFADDPVVTYPLDASDAAHWPKAQRDSLHLKTFECATYAHILRGLALGIPSEAPPGGTGSTSGETGAAGYVAGGFDAVALWMPPGRNMDDYLTLLRSGLWRLRFSYSSQGRARFYDEFLPLLHRTKAEVMRDRDHDSWYLVYLGTRERARGQGLARQLIRYGTEMADAEHRATYLESSHRANVRFYEKLGFVVRRTVALKEEPKAEMDVMVREPGFGKA